MIFLLYIVQSFAHFLPADFGGGVSWVRELLQSLYRTLVLVSFHAQSDVNQHIEQWFIQANLCECERERECLSQKLMIYNGRFNVTLPCSFLFFQNFLCVQQRGKSNAFHFFPLYGFTFFPKKDCNVYLSPFSFLMIYVTIAQFAQ